MFDRGYDTSDVFAYYVTSEKGLLMIEGREDGEYVVMEVPGFSQPRWVSTPHRLSTLDEAKSWVEEEYADCIVKEIGDLSEYPMFASTDEKGIPCYVSLYEGPGLMEEITAGDVPKGAQLIKGDRVMKFFKFWLGWRAVSSLTYCFVGTSTDW